MTDLPHDIFAELRRLRADESEGLKQRINLFSASKRRWMALSTSPREADGAQMKLKRPPTRCPLYPQRAN